jgi:hypothetical protein
MDKFFRSTLGNDVVLKIVYLLLVTIIIYLLFSHWAYDDPFITYRYAQNLAQGDGFVYNPGQRVLSTTTPLFAILLALLTNIWSDIPHLANLIGSFSIALGGLFLWDLGQSWKTPIVGWTSLLLYPTFPLLLSTIGSETPLYLALCLGSFAFYARRQLTYVAIFSALAILTRPDAVLVPILLGIDYLFRERRSFPWRAIFLFLLIILPWFVFAWVYFGSPLPATLATKQQQGAMTISQRFAPGLFTVTKGYASHWLYRLEAVLALGGIFWMFWRKQRWILMLSWTALYFFAYSILGVTRYFWYYAPLVPGFIILVGLGITLIYEILLTALHRIKINHKKAATFANILVIFLLMILFLSQGQSVWRFRQAPDDRITIYRAVGEWLEANTHSNASVGALEVGIIGYYAQRYMVDFAGLIQPDVALQLKRNTTYEDAALWAVGQYHPDYLVLYDGVFPHLEDEYISKHCHFVQTFEGHSYDYSRNINIYTCEQ